MLQEIHVAVLGSLGELYRYDVPVSVRTRLVSGLEKIKGVLRKEPSGPEESGHIMGHPYPRLQPPVSLIRNSNFLEEIPPFQSKPQEHPEPPESLKERHVSFASTDIVHSYPAEPRTTPISSHVPVPEHDPMEEDIADGFKRVVIDKPFSVVYKKVNASGVDETEAKKRMDQGKKLLTAGSVPREFVTLPYSWEELTKLITADDDESSKGSSSNGTLVPQICNDIKPVTTSSIQKLCKKVSFTHEDPEDMGMFIPPSFKSRARHRTNFVPTPDWRLSQTLKFPPIRTSQLYPPGSAARLRKRMQSDPMLMAVLPLTPCSSSSSSLDSIFSFVGNAEPLLPSTTLENVSAEMKGWARRKSQQLAQAKNRVVKLFKKT